MFSCQRLGVLSSTARLLVSIAAFGVMTANAQERLSEVKPRVVSINVCADQLVLSLADDEQIQSLSFLSVDPFASVMVDEAERYPINRGTAEEVIALQPDLVIAGQFSARYTLELLAAAGIPVQTLTIADSVAKALENIAAVGEWLQQRDRAERVVAELSRRIHDLPVVEEPRPTAAIYDPRGYTVGGSTLRGDMLALSGWANVAEQRGVQAYGSLPLETLLMLAPAVLVASPYSSDTWSRAQALNRHPALSQRGLGASVITIPSPQTLCGGPWTVDVVERLAQERVDWQASHR